MFTEDLSILFNTNHFGVVASITPIAGTARNINVIYDNEYTATRIIDDIQVENREPQIMCKTSDVTDITNGAAVTVAGKSYKVLGAPQPDGTGISTIILTLTTDY